MVKSRGLINLIVALFTILIDIIFVFSYDIGGKIYFLAWILMFVNVICAYSNLYFYDKNAKKLNLHIKDLIVLTFGSALGLASVIILTSYSRFF